MDRLILHLWCAYPDDLLDEEAEQACALLLSDDEKERWRGFKFDRHRREYLATHALARIALSQYRGIPPQAWRFQMNAYGKPSVAPECGLHFNLSNALSLVVCLISEGAQVGVDVESRARSASIAEVGPRMFSTQEMAQFESLPEVEKPERAIRLWTLKEAYVKARGMGLALPLNEFSFLFEDAKSIRMEMDRTLDDSPSRWRFCLLQHAAHCIALVAENRGVPELNVWEARPLLAPAKRLVAAKELWFPVSAGSF
jgi:4'-phosphopantetheinyl transferase